MTSGEKSDVYNVKKINQESAIIVIGFHYLGALKKEGKKLVAFKMI